MTKFKLGNIVTWTSQAGGVTRTKLGEVIEVVYARHQPNSISGVGMYRDHDSYVVKASVVDGRVHQLKRSTRYWPRASKLILASKEMQEVIERRRKAHNGRRT